MSDSDPKSCFDQIRKARALAVQGNYAQAVPLFNHGINLLSVRIQKAPPDPQLQKEWNVAMKELKDEVNQCLRLANAKMNDNRPISKPRAIEPKAPPSYTPFEDDRPLPTQVKRPNPPMMDQLFRGVRDEEGPPFKRPPVDPNEMQFMPQRNPYDAFNGYPPPPYPGYYPPPMYGAYPPPNPGLVQWMGKPKYQENYKDPMVWDPPPPPPPRKEIRRAPPKKSPSMGTTSKASTNGEAKNRNYDKPWLKPNDPEADPKAGNKGGKSDFLYHCYPDGKGPDEQLIMMLEREVIDKNPNVSFDDIAALDDAKQVIQETVLLPLMMPEYFTGIRKPRKGVLLFGPPGTGKTMLAKAVASKGKTTFFNVHASSLASKWKGESEKLVRILFEMARFYAPTTIFIDEIDSLATARSDGECESSRKVKTELLVQIDGAAAGSELKEGEKPKNVILLGATNLPWDLDSAIIRRLDKRIYIPLPGKEARKKLFELMLKNVKVEDGIDWDSLVKKTEMYSGDDINNLCRDAAMMPLRRKLLKGKVQDKIDNVEEMQKELKETPVSMQDFLDALNSCKPTNTKDKLGKYKQWMDTFGSN